jgi:hypothetical protein
MYSYTTTGKGYAVSIIRTNMGRDTQIAFLQGDDAEQFLIDVELAESIDDAVLTGPLVRGRITKEEIVQNVMRNYDI